MMTRFIGRSAALLALLVAGGVRAAETDMTEAEALYIKECSKCHGTTTEHTAWPPLRQRGGLVKVASDAGAPIRAPRLAFSFPYGPSLKGIYGRAAGTAPSYKYSKAFMKYLGGMVWSPEILDVYLTDAQAMAPGIIMFYRQPDPAVRLKIIEYLGSGG